MVVQRRTLITAVIIIVTAAIGVVLDLTIVCRVCVLFLLIICIIRGMQERYFLNPYYMFAIVPFTLLIYVKISNYHLDLTTNTWVIAIINIAAFIIALDFTQGYKKTSKCVGLGEGSELTTHIVLLLGIGFLPSVYSIIFKSNMPFGSMISLFATGAVVGAVKSKRKSLIILVTVMYVVSWIEYVSKFSILTFVLAVIIAYEKFYVTTTRQRMKSIIIAVIGAIIMIISFSFANQGRENASGQAALDYYARYGGAIWNGNSALFMPYMYLTTPWTNLQYVMETQNKYTHGLWMLKPLLNFLQIDGLFGNAYNLTPYSNFNTFTYIACCFKDFGFWGSCISSVFLGFFTKKVYSRYKISRSPLDVACYALLSQAVLEMFFSNHFYMHSYPFTIVIIMGIYKKIFCKKSLIEIEPEYITAED